MIIKKHSNGNQYLLTNSNMWVRNFTLPSRNFIDINKTIKSSDHFTFLKNETQNGFGKYQWIDSENIEHDDIIIVSDGYNFKELHKILSKIPRNICIIGVNGTLSKWEVLSRSLNYYVVNNPYDECMRYFPRTSKILPKCIASVRTHHSFLENYRGSKYRYYPVNEKEYHTHGSNEVRWQIDDYRNAICAAIGLSHRFNVQRLLLLCCDNSFEEKRDGSIQLENGLFMYPQQKIAHDLIDGNLYWLKNQDYKNILISSYSNGILFDNALNIKQDEILSFFGVKDE